MSLEVTMVPDVVNPLEDVECFAKMIDDQAFEVRNLVVKYCTLEQGEKNNKKLQGTKGYVNNDRRMSLSCCSEFCRFTVECQQTKGYKFRLMKNKSVLIHGGVHPITHEQVLCSGAFQPNAQNIMVSQVFITHKANESRQNQKKKVASSDGHHAPTVYAIKKANSMIKKTGISAFRQLQYVGTVL